MTEPGAPPDVAVVMPAYNAAASIEASVASILTQPDIDFELVVVDDGSDDETVAIVGSMAASDDRVRLVELEHRGVSGARNAGIAATAAEVVTFLDADDTVEPDWLVSLAGPLIDDDAVGLACCGVESISDGEQAQVRLPEVLGGLFGDGRALFLAGTFAARRSLVLAADGYDEQLAVGENYDLGIRLQRELRARELIVRIIDRPLLHRTIVSSRRSSRDLGRLISAERTLAKYERELADEPASRSKYHRIAAVNAARVGRSATSRGHGRRAVRAAPLELKAWRVCAAAHVKILAERWQRDEVPSANRTHPAGFIVGSPRSGTTLLATLLDVHPDIAVPNESGFMLEALAAGNAVRTPLTSFVEARADDPRLLNWGLSLEQWFDLAAGSSHGRPTDLLGLAYEAFASQQGARLVIDKTPQFGNFTGLLQAEFPSAQVIHLVRDGRDVALSWLDGDWGVESIAEAAYRWDRQNRKLLAVVGRLGDRYQRIHYENLVRDPTGALQPVARALDIDLDSDLLEQREGSQRQAQMPRPQYHSRLMLRPTPGLRDWQQQMSTEDVMVFERIAGRTLSELGYAVMPRPRSWFYRGHVSRARIAAGRAATKLGTAVRAHRRGRAK